VLTIRCHDGRMWMLKSVLCTKVSSSYLVLPCSSPVLAHDTEARVLREITDLRAGETHESGQNYMKGELHNLYSLPHMIRMMTSLRTK
jgi:hypothetical protein